MSLHSTIIVTSRRETARNINADPRTSGGIRRRAAAVLIAMIAVGPLLLGQTIFTGTWQESIPRVLGDSYLTTVDPTGNYNLVMLEYIPADPAGGILINFNEDDQWRVAPILAQAYTVTRTDNRWNHPFVWTNGVPTESTAVQIIDSRMDDGAILLPSLAEGAVVARSLTVFDAANSNGQLVTLVGGTLNLTPAAAELVKVGIPSAFAAEPRFTRLTLDGTTLTSTGFATIGKGVPVGAGGSLDAQMWLVNGARWFHPSGLIELGGGNGTGSLSVATASVLAGDFFPGVGQDPRLFINPSSSAIINGGGTGRFAEISVNSTDTGARLGLYNYGVLDTHRLALGETSKGKALFGPISVSSVGAVSFAKGSEMKVLGAMNADSVNLDDGGLAVDGGTFVLGDPATPAGFVSLLDMAANPASSASLQVQTSGTVTAHGSAALGGLGAATLIIDSGGMLDIRGRATLGQGETISGGAAGSVSVNVTGAVLRAETYEIGTTISPYADLPNPQVNMVVNDGGRIEVTGKKTEYDTYFMGQTTHVTNYSPGTMTIGKGATLDFATFNGTVVFTDPSNGGALPSMPQLTNYGIIKGGGTSSAGSGAAHINFGSTGGTLSNYGTISPGHSAGLLTINGDLSLLATSIMQMELGGTMRGAQYDALIVSGSVFADGTLYVSLLGGFNPTTGASFDLFDFGSIQNTFSVVNLPTLSGGLNWDISALYTTGAISVSAVPEPATYAMLAGLGALVLASVRRQRR